MAIGAIAVVCGLAGCSATRLGKCHNCETTAVYPSEPCLECQSGGAMTVPHGQPAPVPLAEPYDMPTPQPLPPAVSPDVPPPPPEALRARPIQQIGASSRGLYSTMSTNIRAMFTR